MAVRSIEKGNQAVDAIKEEIPYAKLRVLYCEMSSFKSIADFVKNFLALGLPLHILVNNAGLGCPGPYSQTTEGIEQTLMVDYYSHVYLTYLLLDCLKASAPSRVINMSSAGATFGFIDWEDMKGQNLESSGAAAYARAKLMLLMWSQELNKRLKGHGVDVFAVHPGVVHTPGEHKADKSYPAAVFTLVNAMIHGQTPARGAFSTLYAATEPRLQGNGGQFIGPNPFGFQFLGIAGNNTGRRWVWNPTAWINMNYQKLMKETDHIITEVDPNAVPRPLYDPVLDKKAISNVVRSITN